MPRKATDVGKDKGLSANQLEVIRSFIGGASVTDAAAKAAVDRTTVHRWQKSDFAFQASLNRGKQELWDSIEHQRLRIARAAADTVLEALPDGDVKTALAVLKSMGALSERTPPYGSDDPTELEALANASTEAAKIKIEEETLRLEEQKKDQWLRSASKSSAGDQARTEKAPRPPSDRSGIIRIDENKISKRGSCPQPRPALVHPNRLFNILAATHARGALCRKLRTSPSCSLLSEEPPDHF